MLRVENLTVYYGYVNALENVSLHVDRGEIITLIGGNGAGKTTTLMAISSLVEKTGGKVLYKDMDITHVKPEKIARIGIAHVPEGRRIFPALTVRENLIIGSMGNEKIDKVKREELFESNFELFPRLKERISQVGGSLSGGEQQMLAIARGLMLDPELIMLDEPSLGLAPIIVEGIFELILKIRDKGKTVLLIEQNASMALSIADRGYVLETGHVTVEGTGKELLKNDDVQRAYLGARVRRQNATGARR